MRAVGDMPAHAASAGALGLQPWRVPAATCDEIGYAGTLAAIGLFLAPVPTMLAILRRRSTEAFSCLPYAAAFLQCSVWVAYALVTPNRLSPLVTNVAGVALESVYLLVFLPNASDPTSARAVVFGAFGGAFLLIAGVLVLTPHPSWSPALGTVAAALNIVMYAAPLSVAMHVIRTRSVAHMPLLLTLAQSACTASWLAYSMCVADAAIFVPNVVGVALAVVQLGVYASVAWSGGAQHRASRSKRALRGDVQRAHATAAARPWG